jgi:hypothetical protein
MDQGWRFHSAVDGLPSMLESLLSIPSTMAGDQMSLIVLEKELKSLKKSCCIYIEYILVFYTAVSMFPCSSDEEKKWGV